MIVMRLDPRHLRMMIYKYDRMKGVYSEESQNMTRNCAREYKLLLVHNIMTEKYASAYPSLNEKYEEWKEKHGAESGFWKLWGSLVAAISVRPTPKGFSVGIEKNVMPLRTSSMGRKTKLTPVWMYAWYGEYSHRQRGIFTGIQPSRPDEYNKLSLDKRRGIQPSRPVFRPTQYEYNKLFLDKRRKDALDRIKRAW